MAAWEGTQDEKVSLKQREEDGVGEERRGEADLWMELAHTFCFFFFFYHAVDF